MSCTDRRRFRTINELTVPYSPNVCAFVEEVILPKLLTNKHKPAYSYQSFTYSPTDALVSCLKEQY